MGKRTARVRVVSVCRFSAFFYKGASIATLLRDSSVAPRQPSLLIEKNPVSNAFGARHSVCVRHSCALPSYSFVQ